SLVCGEDAVVKIVMVPRLIQEVARAREEQACTQKRGNRSGCLIRDTLISPRRLRGPPVETVGRNVKDPGAGNPLERLFGSLSVKELLRGPSFFAKQEVKLHYLVAGTRKRWDGVTSRGGKVELGISKHIGSVRTLFPRRRMRPFGQVPRIAHQYQVGIIDYVFSVGRWNSIQVNLIVNAVGRKVYRRGNADLLRQRTPEYVIRYVIVNESRNGISVILEVPCFHIATISEDHDTGFAGSFSYIQRGVDNRVCKRVIEIPESHQFGSHFILAQRGDNVAETHWLLFEPFGKVFRLTA